MRSFLVAVLLALVAPLLMGETPAMAAPKAAKKKDKDKDAIGEIRWKVEPADVIIYLDGKKVGTAAKAHPVKVKAGQHIVKLVWKKDEVEEPLNVPLHQSIEFQYVFEDSGAQQPQPTEPTP